MRNNCKTMKAASMEVDGAAMEELKEALVAKDLLLSAANARVDALEAEVNATKTEMRDLKKRKSESVTNLNITNNITVNLPPFHDWSYLQRKGMYSLSYALPDKALVRELLKNPPSAVPGYITAKYFATDTPSIVLPNVKKPELRVVEKGNNGEIRWVTVGKDKIIETMVEKGMEELAENYDAKCKSCGPYASWLKREGLEEDGYDRKPESSSVSRKKSSV